MPAYFVAILRSINNADEMKLYKETAGKAMVGREFRLIVDSAGRVDSLKGGPITATGIIEFPSFAEAEAWYNSAEYQEALGHLFAGGDCETFIAEGYQPV